MNVDTLFLLDKKFRSETGDSQFCPDCMLLEGVLASYPGELSRIEVVHVSFSKPRAALAAIAGEGNQSCPALVRQSSGEIRVVNDPIEILRILRSEYGIPTARGKL